MGFMVDRLLEAGFDEKEIKTMAVTNTRRVAGR
jgi:predicted metal-dependent phosphotriesterase family hydrolase